MAEKDPNSQYFELKGSAKKPYTVTINYEAGHWCTCRGMLSLKGSWGADAGKTPGTSCKHVKEIIKCEFDGDWGTKNPDGSRTPQAAKPARPIPAPPKPSGRRAAVMATRAKLAEEVTQASPKGSLLDRIANLEAAREGASN